MSKYRRPFDDSSKGFKTLEATIWAARNYVAPSEDLRPRTLHAAREMTVERRQVRRLSLVWMAVFAMWGIFLSLAGSADKFRESWVAPSGDDLQRIASESNFLDNADRNWGLVEVFERLRRLEIRDLDTTDISHQDLKRKTDTSLNKYKAGAHLFFNR